MGLGQELPRCPAGEKPGRGHPPPRPHGVICSVTLSPCQRQHPWSFPIPFTGKAERGTALARPSPLLPATAASSLGQPKSPALRKRLQLWDCFLPVLRSRKAEIWQRGQPVSAPVQEPPARTPSLFCPPLGPAHPFAAGWGVGPDWCPPAPTGTSVSCAQRRL